MTKPGQLQWSLRGVGRASSQVMGVSVGPTVWSADLAISIPYPTVGCRFNGGLTGPTSAPNCSTGASERCVGVRGERRESTRRSSGWPGWDLGGLFGRMDGDPAANGFVVAQAARALVAGRRWLTSALPRRSRAGRVLACRAHTEQAVLSRGIDWFFARDGPQHIAEPHLGPVLPQARHVRPTPEWRASSSWRVFSISAASRFSSGKARRYSRASTLLGSPSRA